MKKFFITGTDTDVGKTWITAALLAAFSQHCETKAVKPIQTGCPSVAGKLIAPDVEIYRQVKPQNNFNPRWLFPFPASPHFAAELEGKKLDLSSLITYIESFDAEVLLVEGAGGLFVPLNGEESFIDIIRPANLEVILVGKNILGAINHILLNIEILQSRNIPIAAAVMNQTLEDNPICRSNIDFLAEKIGREIPLISVPFDTHNRPASSSCFFKNFVTVQLKKSSEIKIFKNH